MQKEFEVLKEEFRNLKRMYKNEEISEEEFKSRLKSLQLKDSTGRCWTIGVRTGRWYCYEGEKWIEARPPSLQDKRAICIFCGFENDLESEACVRCGGILNDIDKDEVLSAPEETSEENLPASFRFDYDALEDLRSNETSGESISAGEHSVIRRINAGSVFFFLGGLGIICGILFGVFAGVADNFSGLAGYLPAFLKDLQGGLIGGMIYSLLGGILGFIIFGAAGAALITIFNMILSFTGGIKIHLDRPS